MRTMLLSRHPFRAGLSDEDRADLDRSRAWPRVPGLADFNGT